MNDSQKITIDQANPYDNTINMDQLDNMSTTKDDNLKHHIYNTRSKILTEQLIKMPKY